MNTGHLEKFTYPINISEDGFRVKVTLPGYGFSDINRAGISTQPDFPNFASYIIIELSLSLLKFIKIFVHVAYSVPYFCTSIIYMYSETKYMIEVPASVSAHTHTI